jgi:dynein heavy chain
MCIKLQFAEGIISSDEWNFFLRGGQVLDRSAQLAKPPFDWITTQTWDNITELEKALPETFTGISNAVMLNHKDWHRWYLSTSPAPPEIHPLPGEWETKCEDKLKKMIVLRCFRTDRVNFAVRNYVEHFMKKEFVENRPTQLKEIIDESRNNEPIIFVLSPGVDPTEGLRKMAEERGMREDQFQSISMGRGQSERAKSILSEGCDNGSWIFLANCHLSISLLPELESMIDQMFKVQVHPDFRLILSAKPHPNFSISLLQRSMKVAQEPPKGIKANMLRLYGQKSEFTLVDQERTFRKAVFGLIWFHTVLIERKKFKSLGWNISYAFNDSDYQVCEDLLAISMGQQEEDGKTKDPNYNKKEPIAWPAIRYLIAAANYGGRITDERDRRLIQVYAKEIFNENLIAPERWRPYGTEELNYVYPANEQDAKHADPSALFTPDFFYDEILQKMDDIDPPLAYGQHINAEITSQMLDSQELLDAILGLTPQKVDATSGDDSAGPGKLIADLSERMPERVDINALKHKLRGDENPLNVVLVQELQRYNILLAVIEVHLVQLAQGIKGLVLISPDVEQILNSLNENKIPKAWSFAYFSLKPLANWFADLCERYEFLSHWSVKGIPFHFWIGAFTYPNGFTTSLLQRFSRKASGAPIDKLEFDFVPVPKAPHEITEHPKDGAFISKLNIEGGKWNPEKLCICEPEVMDLACPMPVLHFKPIQKRTKPPQNVYECPCYYYPIRQGSVGTESYQFRVDLKSGEFPSEFWVKRGTALLMSL